jgi:Concanavalin A-like lectin/glucanases superfamily
VVAIMGAVWASPASAATLIGDYQLQGTLASSGTGPALTKVGSGTSQFQNDNVMGSSRQVLAFPLASGVQISPAGVGTGSYSVVTTFRFDNVASYERILDQTKGTEDAGLYVDGDATAPTRAYLAYYGTPPYLLTSYPADVFANNVYATTAVVVTPPSLTSVYVNGKLQFAPTEGRTPLNDTLRLFKDDSTDESPGAVSCIRLYSGGLSAAEVAGIGASPTCGTVTTPVAAPTPTPTTTPHKKKCKKHKKKRSAESAKKKKCKKKRKR